MNAGRNLKRPTPGAESNSEFKPRAHLQTSGSLIALTLDWLTQNFLLLLYHPFYADERSGKRPSEVRSWKTDSSGGLLYIHSWVSALLQTSVIFPIRPKQFRITLNRQKEAKMAMRK